MKVLDKEIILRLARDGASGCTGTSNSLLICRGKKQNILPKHNATLAYTYTRALAITFTSTPTQAQYPSPPPCSHTTHTSLTGVEAKHGDSHGQPHQDGARLLVNLLRAAGLHHLELVQRRRLRC